MLRRFKVSLRVGRRGLIGRSRRRGWRIVVFSLAAGLLVLRPLALTGSAAAATPCGSSGVFSQSGATATCTYTMAGTEDTLSVPVGVSTLSVTAVGVRGGAAAFGDAGG